MSGTTVQSVKSTVSDKTEKEGNVMPSTATSQDGWKEYAESVRAHFAAQGTVSDEEWSLLLKKVAETATPEKSLDEWKKQFSSVTPEMPLNEWKLLTSTGKTEMSRQEWAEFVKANVHAHTPTITPEMAQAVSNTVNVEHFGAMSRTEAQDLLNHLNRDYTDVKGASNALARNFGDIGQIRHYDAIAAMLAKHIKNVSTALFGI